MSDELARFPTPKEAFGAKRPAHISPAFTMPVNVPPPPIQQRYRGDMDEQIQPMSASSRTRLSENDRHMDAIPSMKGAHPPHMAPSSSSNMMYGQFMRESKTASQPGYHLATNYHQQNQDEPPHPQQKPPQQLQTTYKQYQYNDPRHQYQQHHQMLKQRPLPQQYPLQQNQQIPPQSVQPPQNIHKVGRRPVPNNQPGTLPMHRQIQPQAQQPYTDHYGNVPNNGHIGGPKQIHGSSPLENRNVPGSPQISSANSSGHFIPIQQHTSSQSSITSGSSQHHQPGESGQPGVPNQPLQPIQPSQTSDLRSIFDQVDQLKRGYLSEHELSKALVNGDYTLFDAHTVRLMMKMFDRDGDGAIYFAEFAQLWKYLHDWRQVFDRFDTSKNETVGLDEFIRALAAFGYNLSTNCLLFMFNAGSKLNRQGQREMSFDMFVQSCISIKSITDTFKKYDTDRDGYVTMSFEDFLIETTKLH